MNVDEKMKDGCIKLKKEQFEELQKRNNAANRITMDVEIEIQRLKLIMLESQKAVRDYMYQLSESYPIDPNTPYDLRKDTMTLVPKS